jgi:hypothetical protein
MVGGKPKNNVMARRPPTSPSVSEGAGRTSPDTERLCSYLSGLPQFLSLIFFTGEKFRNDGWVWDIGFEQKMRSVKIAVIHF